MLTMRPWSIVLLLFASSQFTAAIPSTHDLQTSTPTIVEHEASAAPSELVSDTNSSSGEVRHHFSRRETSCRWKGGCPGDWCWSKDECSEGLTCLQRRCRGAPPAPKRSVCSWTGHCDGALCRVKNDCSDDRICIDGRCGSQKQKSNAGPKNVARNGTVISYRPTTKLPHQDLSQSRNRDASTDSPKSGTTNVGGNGGNGVIIININGGNGGSGGGTYTIPRLRVN